MLDEQPTKIITTEDLEETPATAETKTVKIASGETSVSSEDGKKKKRKKKARKVLSKGQAHVQASYNNTLVTITDMQGNVVAWQSAGRSGFRGPKKATAYAASIVVRSLAERIKDTGLRELEVYIKGVGQGRESALRALNAQGFKISLIKDVTPMPHNGPRSKKPRRV